MNPIERAAEAVKPLFVDHLVDLDAEDYAWDAARIAFESLDPEALADVIAAHDCMTRDGVGYSCRCGETVSNYRAWKNHAAAAVITHLVGGDVE